MFILFHSQEISRMRNMNDNWFLLLLSCFFLNSKYAMSGMTPIKRMVVGMTEIKYEVSVYLDFTLDTLAYKLR